MRKRIALILTIIWMLVIFCMSAQAGGESQQLSSSVGKTIGRIFVLGYSEWPVEKQMEWALAIDHLVRKSAHVMEYVILAILLVETIVEEKTGHSRRRKQLGICVIIGILYACSDEMHQLMVPGRAGRMGDVFIDSVGVIIGVLLQCVYKTKYKWRKKGD